MKKTTAPKTKEFALNKMELLELENAELKLNNLQAQFGKIMEDILTQFCKRVGRKKEDLILTPEGRIFITPKGTLHFKEN